MLKLDRHKWLIIATVICIIFAIYLYRIESARRGHASPGGEIGIPLFPLIIGSLKSSHEDFKEVIRS